MSILGSIAGGAAINVAMGPLLGFAQRKVSYVLTDAEVDLTGKDVFPMDAPAIIQHVVSSFWRADKAVNSMKSNGFMISNWTNQFFQHTALNNPKPDSMLGLYVDKFQPPQFNEASQADMAAWSAQASPDMLPIYTLLNRQNINRQVANNWMRRLGFRDDATTELMLSLRNEIPPLQDQIRFAVRDSFTVDSVAFYKEANEYPQILDRFVSWLGLGWDTGLVYPASTDDQDRPRPAHAATWGDIYWASHWIEPSPTQGYEMLFRGYTFSPYGPSPYVSGVRGAPDPDKTFDEDDLRKLLKSADYGPYWRKRLEMIAYHPFNITDVKRMYRIGIFDRAAVYHSMRANGYTDDMSETMTEYIIRTERPQITPNVQRSFMLGILTEEQARAVLSNGGLSGREIDQSIAKWKIDLHNQDANIGLRMIHRSMLTGQIGQPVARAALAQLGVNPDRIEMYLRQWDAEIAVSKRVPTLARIMKWYIDGYITEDDFIARLQRLRYSDTDINNVLKEARAREIKQREATERREDNEQQRQQSARDRQAKQAQSQATQRAKEQERQAKDRAKASEDREAEVEMLAKQQKRTADERLKVEQEALDEMMDSIKKGSTDKYLLAFHKKGLLTVDQIRQRLSIRGLDKADVDRWIQTYIPGG